MFAAITLFCLLAKRRINITKNSLVKTIKTVHMLIKFNFKKHKKAPVIKILSAKGSKNFPRFVMIFLCLAISPSKKSVIEATMKIINDIMAN